MPHDSFSLGFSEQKIVPNKTDNNRVAKLPKQCVNFLSKNIL